MNVYKDEEITKEEFVENVVQVEMQCRHFHIACHVANVTIAIVASQTKHEIVNTDMV